MAASNNGRTEAVEQLLQLRADPNMQDHVRTKKKHCSMCELFFYRLAGLLCWHQCSRNMRILL